MLLMQLRGSSANVRRSALQRLAQMLAAVSSVAELRQLTTVQQSEWAAQVRGLHLLSLADTDRSSPVIG